MIQALKSAEFKTLRIEDFPVALRESDHWLYEGKRWEVYPGTDDCGIDAEKTTQELFEALIMQKPHGELYLSQGIDSLHLEARKIRDAANRHGHTQVSEFGSALDTFIRQAFIGFAGKEALRLSGFLNKPVNKRNYWLLRLNTDRGDQTDILTRVTSVNINNSDMQWPLVPIVSDRRGIGVLYLMAQVFLQ